MKSEKEQHEKYRKNILILYFALCIPTLVVLTILINGANHLNELFTRIDEVSQLSIVIINFINNLSTNWPVYLVLLLGIIFGGYVLIESRIDNTIKRNNFHIFLWSIIILIIGMLFASSWIAIYPIYDLVGSIS